MSSIAVDAELSWNPGVATRTIERTAFLLLDSRLVSLNEVGSCIWGLFERGATVDSAVRTVVSRFDVDEATARADVQHFVGVLLDKKMLVRHPDHT